MGIEIFVHDIMEIGKLTLRTVLFKKTVLMCVEGFMLSLISKFHVFINMCLFLSSISMREYVDRNVHSVEDFLSDNS